MAADGANTGKRRLTRRTLLASGAAVASGAALAQAAGAVPRPLRRWLGRSFPDQASSWPMPAHDLAATRNGASAVRLAERWRADFPGGVPATAAISGDCAYVASAQGAVAALSLRDGSRRWRVELGTSTYDSDEGPRQLGFFGGVAISPARVVVASERVHCLDRATGRRRWSSAPLRTSASDDYFWGPPANAGGLVLIGSGSGGELPTARGRLSAFRAVDGSLAWSTPTVPEGANGGGVIGQASVDQAAGLAYVTTGAPYRTLSGTNPGTCSLLALRLRDGAVVWQDQVYPGDTHGFDFNSAPVIVGPRLFATNKDGIYAWDRIRRRRLWHRRIVDPLAGGASSAGPTAGPEGGPIASDGHRLYTLSNDGISFECVAAALSPSDGRVLWSTRLPALTFAAPALGGRRLYVAGSDGTLRALDARTGTIVAEGTLGEPSAAAPAIAHGRLLVGTGAEPYLPGSSLVCFG